MRVVIATAARVGRMGRVDTDEPDDLEALYAELAQGPDLSELLAEANTPLDELLEGLETHEPPEL